MLVYTDAPECYDGFGTRTVEADTRFRMRRNHATIRTVEIPEPARFNDWQVARYRSGLYIAFEEAEWEDLHLSFAYRVAICDRCGHESDCNPGLPCDRDTSADTYEHVCSGTYR